MSGFVTGTPQSEMLTRSTIWSAQLKEAIRDKFLIGRGYVNWLTEFPDGDTFVIPSIGEAVVRDYEENTQIKYDAMDTGEYQFTIKEYISSATYITNKAKQDMFYMNQLVSRFTPEQALAIERRIETDIMALALKQTPNDPNKIHGVSHRFVATGAYQGRKVVGLEDFARAAYALKTAGVPDTNLIAIVDPATELYLNTLTNIVNVSSNPQWEGVINTGLATGHRFVKNIYGFDVYTSSYLADVKTETIDGQTATDAKACIFFSAEQSIIPFIGAFRQLPTVESEYNKDRQREEYLTICRYGVDLYREENLVVVLSETVSL